MCISPYVLCVQVVRLKEVLGSIATEATQEAALEAMLDKVSTQAHIFTTVYIIHHVSFIIHQNQGASGRMASTDVHHIHGPMQTSYLVGDGLCRTETLSCTHTFLVDDCYSSQKKCIHLCMHDSLCNVGQRQMEASRVHSHELQGHERHVHPIRCG